VRFRRWLRARVIDLQHALRRNLGASGEGGGQGISHQIVQQKEVEGEALEAALLVRVLVILLQKSVNQLSQPFGPQVGRHGQGGGGHRQAFLGRHQPNLHLSRRGRRGGCSRVGTAAGTHVGHGGASLASRLFYKRRFVSRLDFDGFFVTQTLILIIFGFTFITVQCSHFLLHARKQEHVKILVYLGCAEKAWPITAQCTYSNIKEEEEWGFIF
jgi:hypothetical protein